MAEMIAWAVLVLQGAAYLLTIWRNWLRAYRSNAAQWTVSVPINIVNGASHWWVSDSIAKSAHALGNIAFSPVLYVVMLLRGARHNFRWYDKYYLTAAAAIGAVWAASSAEVAQILLQVEYVLLYGPLLHQLADEKRAHEAPLPWFLHSVALALNGFIVLMSYEGDWVLLLQHVVTAGMSADETSFIVSMLYPVRGVVMCALAAYYTSKYRPAGKRVLWG